MKLLSFSNKIPFYFYLGRLGCSYSSDRYSVCGKRPLVIAAVNTELPPFKNGEHNSESVPFNPFNESILKKTASDL